MSRQPQQNNWGITKSGIAPVKKDRGEVTFEQDTSEQREFIGFRKSSPR